jgi:5'-3' exoribonuclease 1
MLTNIFIERVLISVHCRLQHQNFFLLHLSLLREYLDLEFSSIAEDLEFDYDLEKIIDDFILLSVFVGNDFLPHLPNLHINEGAMEEIWGIYKRILPVAGGYLNEAGTINLPRLQLVLNELGNTEFEIFEKEYADVNWLKGKQDKEVAAMDAARQKGKLVLTSDQKKIFNEVKAFITDKAKLSAEDARLTLVNHYRARDRRFIQELADALNVQCSWDETDEYGQNLIVIRPAKTSPSKAPSDEGDVASDEDLSDEVVDSTESEDDVESQEAIQRVITKYEKAKVVEIEGDPDEHREITLRNKMEEWKKGYYKEKLECKDDADRRMVVFKYVEGIQWVMNYYYKGVASWGWFYPYHYAPRISDLQGLSDMKFEFEIGTPFKPFQQLMGVLPAASGEHIPAAYRDLMTDPNSPILDFYPEDFMQDMNGKKQEWEAVVKIPFIDEQRLLKAMAARDHRLSPEEQERNRMGQNSTLFIYNEEQAQPYPSSLPGVFPDLITNKCEMRPFITPTLGDGIELINGLLEGVHLGASALAGFPSMKTLPHHAQLGFHGVNVHGTDSRNPSMIIFIDSEYESLKGAEIAKQMVGSRAFFKWPFLHEAMVVAVSDDSFRYEQHHGRIIQTPHDGNELGKWRRTAQGIEHRYSKRYGVVTGHVEFLLHVRPLKGKSFEDLQRT